MVGTELIDRSAELARLDTLLGPSAHGFAEPEIAGAAGIGKTSLWAQARRSAEAQGFTVLWARPAETTAKSSFAAVADLLFAADAELLRRLPPPQRAALEVALLRRPNPRRGPLHRAVAAGLLGVVRELSQDGRLLLAIDDWQWLDRPSRDALEFLARRLEREPVRIVYSLRTPTAIRGLGNAVTDERFTAITLAGFGPTAVARLISGAAALPVPDSLRELLLARIARLPQAGRDELALVAALSQPVTELADLRALTRAEEAGIVEIEQDGRVRSPIPCWRPPSRPR
ncbi:MAG TPA: ATP-binding protein [Solirubrobacteraceae bacterium]|nr:ATP-binding protein [Solirubrobacteraceae bacterium]